MLKKSEYLFLALFLRVTSSMVFVISLDIYFITIIVYSFKSHSSTVPYTAFMSIAWILVGISLFALII